MTMMENHPWRPQRGLPERSVSVLRAWLFEHFLHPYPSDVDKHILARQTGLSRSQVSNWFINARVRLWKPMVEEMYTEETKEHDNLLDGVVSPSDVDENGHPGNPNPLLLPHMEDQKPPSDRLVRIDSDCLSSIISGPGPKADGHRHHHLSRVGIRNPNTPHNHHHHLMQSPNQWMELDLASYNQDEAAGAAEYENVGTNFGGGGGGGGVSLTLGLQQHRGGHHQGVSLAFSPVTAVQGSLFYPREQIEDCHPVVQYSILDGEGQNLRYRNLMGTQLLRDLAG
ncbi:hypothetical protein MLD38_023713 [Melastoma candidum]|uniref:Uncharacterized protein n=1 Tax=Melastoma candidum TaxID=119954 RepID=A0ACB9NSQ8_9MYRT|nr:hypothetical protein MLD38_023713 [Melastoma candidum]